MPSTRRRAVGADRVAVDMESSSKRASTAGRFRSPSPSALLQVVPFGARGFNRPMRIGGPFHHRAVIEPDVLAAEQFVQHEPVGRRPVAGVAIAHRRAGRHMRGERHQLGLRLQPVGRGIVELGAVEIERAGNVAIGRRGRRLFLAGEERRRARVDQRRAAGLLRSFRPRRALREQAFVERGGEDRRRRRACAALDRQAGRRQAATPPSRIETFGTPTTFSVQ